MGLKRATLGALGLCVSLKPISAEFVRGFTSAWQQERERKYPPKVSSIQGADWGDLAVI